MFLPPYFPELHPIENMWSKIKHYLKRKRSSTLAEFHVGFFEAIEIVSDYDCEDGSKIQDIFSIKEICCIRAGNTGMTQKDLNNDESFQALRVRAKLLNAPLEPAQTWQPREQWHVRDWLKRSEHGVRIIKKGIWRWLRPVW